MGDGGTMSSNPDCIFCKIVAGEAAAVKVTETQDALAFMDLFPATPGHALVIPKIHYENLFESTPESLPAVHLLARRVARAIRKSLEPDGLMVFQLNGAAAGQTVFHYHAHLIPRMAGSEFKLHGRQRANDAELEALAQRIAGALE
jgi:histidine triad (HIT) family protein